MKIETNTLDEIRALQEKLNSLKANLNKPLELKQSDKPDLRIGVKKDGKKYSVRDNRDRYFYPAEWMKFYDALTNNQKMTFDFLINTGARINEAVNVKVGDIDLDNKRLILRVTKVKAAKKEKAPRPRPISISTNFVRRLRAYIKEKNLKDENYLGLLSRPAAHIAMKNTLKKIGIKDWYMFSLHNIRKTHGNWLKSLEIDGLEICNRLGHDMNTFLKAYGSSDVFTYKDKQDMRLILGDLYAR